MTFAYYTLGQANGGPTSGVLGTSPLNGGEAMFTTSPGQLPARWTSKRIDHDHRHLRRRSLQQGEPRVHHLLRDGVVPRNVMGRRIRRLPIRDGEWARRLIT